MARVKKGMNAKRKHKKILKLAKGFYGSKHKIFSAANPAVSARWFMTPRSTATPRLLT